MTAFDIFVLITLGLSALYGLSRGLTVEVLSVGAWLVALIALKILFTPVSHWLRHEIGSDAGGDIAALLMILFVTVALVRLAARFVGGQIKDSALAPIDRLGGAGFGLMRGLIIVSLAYMFLGLFLDKENLPDWIRQSKTEGIVAISANSLSDFIGWVRTDGRNALEGHVSGFGLSPENPDSELQAPDNDGYSEEERKELDELFKKSEDKEVNI